MMFIHWSHIPKEIWTWENFHPKSDTFLACPCCGEIYVHKPSLDKLQSSRVILAKPMSLNSGHRCWHRNALVGGVINSAHRLLSFDVSTRRHDRYDLLNSLAKAGFTTFGLYKTFIHTDNRPNRRWYGNKGAKQLWTSDQLQKALLGRL